MFNKNRKLKIKMENSLGPSIIDLMDKHPGILTVTIIIVAILISGVLFGLFRGVKSIWRKTKKFKLGNNEIEFNSDNPEKQSSAARDYDQRLAYCLSQVIQMSVSSGFDRSVKRQELFDRQCAYANARYSNIIGEIKDTYLREKSNINLQTIDVVLNYLFRECAVRELEVIFKADHLIEKSKDEIVENNRHIINSTAMAITLKAQELSISKNNNGEIQFSVIDDTLLGIIKEKATDIKKATTAIIEQAYTIAVEEMKNMSDIHAKLNKDISEVLATYFGSKNGFPETWNDSLPPNNVIGELAK